MKRQVFISSVQSEFSEERKQLAEFIRQDVLFSRYFEPFLFEELPAQNISAQKAYLEAASRADIYMLLLGERYGFEDTDGISPTEREYDTATANSVYRLAFLKDVQKWFPAATVKCAQFYGTRVEKPILSQQIYDGNVFEVVDRAVGFVLSRIDARVGERTQSAQVDVSYELPVQAVTEAIVNAVAHRDYSSTGSVQVMLFKDRLEVWNPGRLPQGMTIVKLNGEHQSIPVNPVLAHPVYLAGYIEQLGTGTTDLINRCLALGLRRPEFRQDESFVAILWRREPIGNAESGNMTGKVTGNAAGKVTGNVKRIVLAIGGGTFTRDEIMQRLSLKGSGNFRATYLYPAIEQGYVSRLYPDSPNRPDQAYYLTEKGLDLFAALNQQ